MRRFLPVICVLLVASLAHAQYTLGPFSRLSKYGEGYLWNGFFGVQVERGFKLHALVPEPTADGLFGRPEFAGFLTLEVKGQPLFQRFTQPDEGTQTTEHEAAYVITSKHSGRYQQIIEMACGHPFAWVSALVPPEDRAETNCLLTGYEWAQKKPPDSLQFVPPGETQPRTAPLMAGAEPLPARLGQPLVLIHDASGKFQLALVFPSASPRLTARADGLAIHTSLQPSGMLFAIGILPADMTWQAASALVPLAFSMPEARKTSYALADGKPSLRLDTEVAPMGNEWSISAIPTVALPPTLADRAPAGAIRLPTLWGEVALCPGASVKLALSPVPRLDEIAPPVKSLRPEWQANMKSDVEGVLGQLRPEGGFTSSRGRTFYDGLTCSGLMLAYPHLQPEQQKQVATAVKRTLDLWWNGLRQDGETGIWYFPEPVPAVPVVDYPEITATILWPTVQYAAAVDPAYAKALAPKLAKLGPSLSRAYDWTGAAYAYPGPEFLHVITESVIGGFVAWCAMNRLAVMNGETALADEYAARAAFAAESMKLLRWQDRYGPSGVVSELRPDSLKVKPTIAWDYTMYTWFSYVPAFELPREDLYKVWENLEKAQWWNYSVESKQRCYDYAHVMALARTFGPQAVADKLPLFDGRPFSYDSFDSTPAYRLMAYPWLAAME